MIKSKKHQISNKLILFIGLFLLNSSPLYAQDLITLADFNEVRLDYNVKGMLVLGSWALINIIWGGIGIGRTVGLARGFHEMNLYWNLVNLVIASIGFWQAKNELIDLDFWQTIESQHSITQILWLNLGLDVGYIIAGFFLIERGLRKSKDRLVGFGKSLILQGAFLFLFDGILVGFHEVHENEMVEIASQVSISYFETDSLSLK